MRDRLRRGLLRHRRRKLRLHAPHLDAHPVRIEEKVAEWRTSPLRIIPTSAERIRGKHASSQLLRRAKARGRWAGSVSLGDRVQRAPSGQAAVHRRLRTRVETGRKTLRCARGSPPAWSPHNSASSPRSPKPCSVPRSRAWADYRKAAATIRFYRKPDGSSNYRVLEHSDPLHVLRQPSPWSLTATFAERLVDALKSLLPRK